MTEKGRPLPWWPRDFAADEHVMLMSLEAEGAYRRLLDHQWLHGSIPADPVQLARICKGIPVSRLRKLWGELAPVFTPIGEGRYQNQRLERVRDEDAAYREKKASAGRESGRVRRNKAGTDDERDVNTTGTEPRTDDEPPSPSPSPVSTTAAGRAMGKLINAVSGSPDRFTVMGLFDHIPTEENPDTWAGVLLSCLQLPLSGPKSASVSQLAVACADFPALAKGKWTPRHFRACVVDAMRGKAPPKSKGMDSGVNAAREWLEKEPAA